MGRPENVRDWTDQDWRDHRLEHFIALDPMLREKAVRALWTNLLETGEGEHFFELMQADPDHWLDDVASPDSPMPIPFHLLGGGMAVRNFLRQQGFTEEKMGIDNWDDYYIPVFEVAVQRIHPELHLPWKEPGDVG